MGRKMVSVETLHGYTIDELIELKNSYKDIYGYTLLSIVINRYQGIRTDELTKIYNKSITTIIEYIHKWNALGPDALKDKRGGSVGTFTDDMLQTIKEAIEDGDATNYGYESSTWTIAMFIDLVQRKFGKQYSFEWIRRVIIKNNFSYKRGQYKPTYANPEEQELFKKNARSTQYCRKFY